MEPVAALLERVDLHIRITQPTDVFDRPYGSASGPANGFLFRLDAGTVVHARREVLGKDYLCYEVELPNGRTGFIQYNGLAMELKERR